MQYVDEPGHESSGNRESLVRARISHWVSCRRMNNAGNDNAAYTDKRKQTETYVMKHKQTRTNENKREQTETYANKLTQIKAN